LPELNQDLPCGGQHIRYRSTVRDKVQPRLAPHVITSIRRRLKTDR